MNILALSLLAVIMRNPHMMEELENSYDYNVDMNAPALPTPLSKVDPPFAYRDHSLIYRKQYRKLCASKIKYLSSISKGFLHFQRAMTWAV